MSCTSRRLVRSLEVSWSSDYWASGSVSQPSTVDWVRTLSFNRKRYLGQVLSEMGVTIVLRSNQSRTGRKSPLQHSSGQADAKKLLPLIYIILDRFQRLSFSSPVLRRSQHYHVRLQVGGRICQSQNGQNGPIRQWTAGQLK